jgi:ketosteroid isomerase-like protein
MSTSKTITNTDTIRKIYEAFGRRDVPGILEHLADNVDWDNSRTAAREIPWYGNFSGKNKVPEFFMAVAQHIDLPVFEPREFVGEGNHVVVRLHLKGVLKKNSKSVEYDAIHFWTFDGSGRVSAYRQYNDTAADLAAWRS